MSRILEWLWNLAPGELDGVSWRLGFAGGQNNYLTLGLLVLLAGLIWLTVHCYRRDGQISRRMRVILASLRIAAIVLVLLALFQPAIIIRISQTLYSSVLVLVDQSQSMALTDRYAEETQAKQRAALAKRLGVEEDQLETLSRYDISSRLLDGENSVLWKLTKDHPVELISFSTNQSDAPYTQLVGTLERESTPGQTPASAPSSMPASAPTDPLMRLTQKAPEGFQTDPATAIRSALDRFQGRRIGAIVVISDGQPTTAQSDKRLAAALDYAGKVPRYTVTVGDPTPPKNIAITALRAPREIRANSQAEFEVVLSHRNLAGKKVTVKLYRRKIDAEWPKDFANTPPLQKEEVTLVALGNGEEEGDQRGVQTVRLNVKAKDDQLGEYVYRAVVDAQPGERSDEDNRAEAFVKVSDEKIRILLVSGDAGWEFQYLRNYFLRQPELYRLSVWQQNADPEVNQAASSGMKLSRLPQNIKELVDSQAGKEKTPASKPKEDEIPPGYHVVILYDPEPTENGFDADFIKNLHEFVTKHHGGLAYIASNRNTYAVLRDKAAKPLADLLPVTVDRGDLDVVGMIREGRDRANPAMLTAYGMDHPITRLEGSGKENKDFWAIMPGFYWSQPVASKKPTARVLVEHPFRKMKHSGAHEPIVAVQTVGGGRVAYIGFDETWRWRFIEEGLYHRRFWSNLVRYLTPVNARQVVITAGGDRFSVGEEITVEVEAFDSDYRPMTRKTLPLKMINTRTGEESEYTLNAVAGKSGRYKATIVAAHTGPFELTVDESIADSSRVAAKQIAIVPPQAESRRTEANPRVMQRIASRPEFALTAENMDQLARLISSGKRNTVDEKVHSLWDTNFMWLLIVILLATEWFIRKRLNLT